MFGQGFVPKAVRGDHIETEEEIEGFSLIGRTQRAFFLSGMGFALDLRKGLAAWEGTLEGVYPRLAAEEGEAKTLSLCEKPAVSHAPGSYARPSVLIPVFPGTNCEFDLSKALADSNFVPRVMVIRNRDKEAVTESVRSFSRRFANVRYCLSPEGFPGRRTGRIRKIHRSFPSESGNRHGGDEASR